VVARKLSVLAAVAVAVAVFVALACACDKSGGKAEPKFFCKMQGECFRCADLDQQKKCTLNPVTSGCTKVAVSDCDH
jgi:hypothetical protein